MEAIDPVIDDPTQLEEFLCKARPLIGDVVDLYWHMHGTDLALFDRLSGSLLPVTRGFC